jgi:hypothetical protein
LWEREDVPTGFWWRNLREGHHLEDSSLDWRIILKRIFEKFYGGMDRIDPAQDRDRWRNFLKNVRVPKNTENFKTS